MSVFRFKQFSVTQAASAMKVGTDAMLLGSMVEAESPKRILDVGSGTGVIALMLAQRYPDAIVSGVELDALSAAEAKSNFEASPWKDRMGLVHLDFLEFESEQKFDLIVSNPPYYQSRLENQDVRKAQARHESALPMDEMILKASELLTETGRFWVIVPSEVWDGWRESAEKNGLHLRRSILIRGKEKAQTKRYILSFRKTEASLQLDHFTIRNFDGSYTKEYIELTKEFHFNQLSV